MMSTNLIQSFDATSGQAQLESPLAARPGQPIYLNRKQVGKVSSRATLLIQDTGAKRLIAQAVLFRLNQEDGQLTLSDTPTSKKATKVLRAGGAFLLVKHQRRPSVFNQA